ncbi:hypothetical protein [Nevskia soli]|uniref:hypothetical protein n=1 Tax=Nevskia soli TaxID=418856 RepID=UPI0015D7CAA2|nr:hypothetical protein [Nevskia soli]
MLNPRADVPTYAANGSPLRRYSVAQIERCLALTPPRVVVKRNKRTGKITSAQFLPLPRDSRAIDGQDEIRKTAHMGQRYSYRSPVDDQGHRVWRFSKFLVPHEMRLDPGIEPEDIERWLQTVFRAVPLSCLKGKTK